MATNDIGNYHEHQVYTKDDEVPFSYIRLIGNGAVGVVEKVRGTSGPFQGKIYARKIIQLLQDQDREEELREIEGEVNALRNVQHHHGVRLVKTYLFEDNYAIIMDPLADGNLDNYLQDANKSLNQLDRDRIAQWFGCLINGMAYLHGKGIRHRDVKPKNILINDTNILFTDFGISMMGLGKTVPTTILNRPRSRTEEYCAPEVDAGSTRGRSADIFSLGAVILEMLTAYSYPNKLTEFKKKLEYEKSKFSYAKKLEELSKWMDTLVAAPQKAPWHSTILFLCQQMLQTDRDLRPKADDMHLWLAHQQFSPGLPAHCNCNVLLDDIYSNGGITEMLQKAYKNGHRLMRDLLIDRGAVIDDNDALIAACEGGLQDTVEFLLDKGVNVNIKGALHEASAGGFVAIVQILLDHGANVDMKDDRGLMPLQYAASRGHKDVVQLLLEKHADVTVMGDELAALLQWAVTERHHGTAEQVLQKKIKASPLKQLPLHQVEINAETLHLAVDIGDEVLLSLQLDRDAHIDTKNSDGCTPLARAVQRGHEVIVWLLLRCGADVEATNSLGETPLWIAARAGHGDIVKLLADMGANISRKDEHGRTVLHLVVDDGKYAMAKLLAEIGVRQMPFQMTG